MSYPVKPRSSAWFLLPIFFGIIGGLVGFFVLRKDDPRKAKICLYIGIIMMVIGIMINVLLYPSIQEIDSGFNINT